MKWKESFNAVMTRATGYRLERAVQPRDLPQRPVPPGGNPGDRLLVRPVFILSTVRSGSTLLRVILDSHSQIHAPHEVHLRDTQVRLRTKYARRSLNELGLDRWAATYLFWDRLLHRELAASGKRVLVTKTPNNVFIADRIVDCWPDARFIFLLRHPAATLRSREKVRPRDTPERNLNVILRYARSLEVARQTYPGHTVRYEALTANPEGVTQALCEFLEVSWESGMLAYRAQDHGDYRPGLGDWSDKIRSGRIQPPAPLPAPESIPAELCEISAAWGYLPGRS